MFAEYSTSLTWFLSAAAVGGVIVRPFGLPEWVFAVAGAMLLAILSLIPWSEAVAGIADGLDVYLFLTGMMLLSEVARREGLFDFLAAHAARAAKGSPARLFALVYGVGTVVTVFLSNDATAVVLTPAVAAVARAAGAKSAMPYLLVCAFVANAASFALPISNPANLVIFGERIPELGDWISRFALPSLASILATYLLLRRSQRGLLQGAVRSGVDVPVPTRAGRIAAAGIVLGAAVLLVVSALGLSLGWPTTAVGAGTLLAVMIVERSSPLPTLRDVSWGILPLVAGLFVVVRALDRTGLNLLLARHLETAAHAAPDMTAAGVAGLLALATNLTNNLPLGLVAGQVVNHADMPTRIVDAVLIGIDLGPNLSVTGSLATILWLTALRREGLEMSAWGFLKLGFLVMPPALVLAVAVLLLQPWS